MVKGNLQHFGVKKKEKSLETIYFFRDWRLQGWDVLGVLWQTRTTGWSKKKDQKYWAVRQLKNAF